MPKLLKHRSSQCIQSINLFTKRDISFFTLSGTTPAKLLLSIPMAASMSTSMSTQSSKMTTSPQINRPLQAKRDKRPPLTHFLCLPLISDTSLPVLENSVAKFRRNIPLAHSSSSSIPVTTTMPAQSQSQSRRALFPDSAIRPLGTLHLTLGVMSLTTADRIEEAVKFLQSLDTQRMLQEVELEIAIKNHEGNTSSESLNPISISLESLSSLPKAKAATVLYANPVDPTSRLYPFAVKLRDAFVEAGFIQQDVVKQRPKKHKKGGNGPAKQQSESNENNNNNNNNRNENKENIIAAEPEEENLLQQRKPKFRPLLLHATLVNTIHVRRERDSHHSHDISRGSRGRKHIGPLSFDARDIQSRYRDFFTDDTCKIEKQVLPVDNNSLGTSISLGDDEDVAEQNKEEDDSASLSSDEEAHPSKTVAQLQQQYPENRNEGLLGYANSQAQIPPKYPFIWARDVPIERLCLCEMGAKKLDDGHPLAARLGQEYRVVAEKSLSYGTTVAVSGVLK